ncbi:Ger(x)C family spore germination protein [Cohnella faecalis]|uniref:Ger(X)C family spore germination protein n=1 Tax=Cohnella faecalis TaxID=2315694 RepID=A0A398CPR8_9BACL|nr:Ger(x)C family spore germination protein [Cohnella faecalis]RIE04180.1 Ger(x)C family spore germination protein [Cohnella faecalis]
MKIALRVILVSLLALITGTGCWDRRELNELGIQLGAAIDKSSEGYELSVQVVDPGQVASAKGSGGINRAPVTMYKASAPSILEAYRKLTQTSPRKIYNSHLRVLVIGEELARDGIAKALEMQSRGSESRTDFFIMIARKTSAENVLKIITPLEKIPANKMYYSLDASARSWAPTTTFTLDKFINQLVTDGLNPVLTGIDIVGSQHEGESNRNVQNIDPAARLVFSGLAVFRRDKLVGWLNEEESRGYNIIMNNLYSTAGPVTCPNGGNVIVEILRSHTKMTGKMVGDKPVIDLTFTAEANVGEIACDIDITDPQSLRQLEKTAAKLTVKALDETIDSVKQKYNTDIFGFGDAIHRYHPRQWKKVKDKWANEMFQRTEVRFHIHFYIRRTSTKGNSFIEDLKR